MIESPKELSSLVITRVLRVLTVRAGRTHWECENKPIWAIVIRHSGRSLFQANGEAFLSDPEHVLILPKGATYCFDVLESGTYSLVEFDADQVGSTLFSLPLGNKDRLLKALRRMEYNNIIGHPYFALEQIHGVYEMLLSLLTEAHFLYVQPDKARVIEKIVDYISRHYRENLTNAALAKRCGISEVYFRKLFSEITGVSPITYLHKLRIGKAAELLQEGRMRMSEIAETVGYSSIYHFSAMFKKYQGMPPSKYERLFKDL